jgi:hypothetical protein
MDFEIRKHKSIEVAQGQFNYLSGNISA